MASIHLETLSAVDGIENGKPYILVVDAIDACGLKWFDAIFELLFENPPRHLRVLVTSRLNIHIPFQPPK
jgi:hypothetical protein